MDNMKSIHEEIKRIAKRLEDEQGVAIDSVHFDWIRTADGKAFLAECRIDTSTQ